MDRPRHSGDECGLVQTVRGGFPNVLFGGLPPRRGRVVDRRAVQFRGDLIGCHPGNGVALNRYGICPCFITWSSLQILERLNK